MPESTGLPGSGHLKGPEPGPEPPCDLAARRQAALESGRARFAALRRWWASLGPEERTAMENLEARREKERR